MRDRLLWVVIGVLLVLGLGGLLTGIVLYLGG